MALREADFAALMKELEEERNRPVTLGEARSIGLRLDNTTCRFYRVKCLTYEKDFPRQEAFENVVASINNVNCRLVYYLRGSRDSVEFYVGVVKLGGKDKFSAGDYGEMLQRAFKGNFLGSSLEEIEGPRLREMLETLGGENIEYGALLGVPSRNSEREDISFQGVDRLVNIMTSAGNELGRSFHLLVVWEPVDPGSVRQFENSVKEIYSALSGLSKRTIQQGSQEGGQKGKSSQVSESEGESENYGKSKGESKTVTTGDSDTWGKNEGKSHTAGWSSGSSSQKSGSTSTNGGTNESHGKSRSESAAKTSGENFSAGRTRGKTVTEGANESKSWGSSESESREEQNKAILDVMDYIKDELLPRIRRGLAKGMYKTAVYVGAGTTLDRALLENALVSICQGDKPVFNPLHAIPLQRGKAAADLVSSFNIRDNIPTNAGFLPLDSRPVARDMTFLGTWLTAAEISMLAGMPQKEVPGLELRAQVAFGLNIENTQEANKLELGHMLQEGNELWERRIWLDREDLSRHVFIAGTTGSGKTTTCHRLLASSSASGKALPFMVIEPAKTEYRALLNDQNLEDVIIFTVGNEKGVPFRFNPFEFLQGESLSGHVDLLKASFMASFDMEAAIPNLLEEGLYRAYEAYGWNFRDETNRFLENTEDAWKCGGLYFPTISSYIRIVTDLVEDKGFDEKLKNDYKGSIRARLDSLLAGSKGLMLDTPLSVDFMELIDKKVILELEDLKSSEDKSFLMGLVLARMTEALKIRHRQNPAFRHITLLEEAHRLLSRPGPGDSPNRRLGVETFCDLLAEVRKYGESLIIVDQIPCKLAPEVLKNTNTKIIHKLFARDDKDTVGDTMALDDRQKNYLSNLDKGEAVMFSLGWKKPVNVKIERVEGVDTNAPDVEPERVAAAGWKWWSARPDIFLPGLDREKFADLGRDEILELADLAEKFRDTLLAGKNWLGDFAALRAKAGDAGRILAPIFAREFLGCDREAFLADPHKILGMFLNGNSENWRDATRKFVDHVE